MTLDPDDLALLAEACRYTAECYRAAAARENMHDGISSTRCLEVALELEDKERDLREASECGYTLVEKEDDDDAAT